MKYDIHELSDKLSHINKELNHIDRDEIIKKYGTYLDSKQDVLQLYLLFIFFGLFDESIRLSMRMKEYDID